MRPRSGSVELFDEGIEAVKIRDYKRAIRIGRELHSQKYTGAFEILGRVYAAQGNLKKAIKELERGVQVAPTVWTLWQYLAEFYSDEGRYEEALLAFARAETAGDGSGWPLYNQAVVRWRMGEPQRGLDLLDHRIPSTDDELESKAIGLRLRFLNELGRHSEVVQFAQNYDGPIEEIYLLDTELGYAYFGMGDLEKAKEVVNLDPFGHPRTLWLIRELDSVTSPNSVSWDIVVRGTSTLEVEGSTGPYGFFSTFLIKAPTKEAAFEFAKTFVQDSETEPELSNAKRNKRKLEGYDGVYWMSDERHSYKLDEATE